ncbi:hypothetical protein [Helicovermis profundi]|uniref:Ferritin family protein n=1 Tax=Helicovermis profundi TaxID=3065157 RepID=A0AAU9EVW8_9FIRM|nr:ferritin family protein [Clostridia bacterium S502]
MREVFALEDIFNVMIELETLGNIHYDNMKGLTDVLSLKVLFESLAKQEFAHKKLYEKYKKEIISFNSDKVDDEYRAYMDVLLEQTVKFLSESREVTNFQNGFDISIQLEKDTILFLNEIRLLIDSSYYESIDRIISQEKGHLRALFEYKNKLKLV